MFCNSAFVSSLCLLENWQVKALHGERKFFKILSDARFFPSLSSFVLLACKVLALWIQLLLPSLNSSFSHPIRLRSRRILLHSHSSSFSFIRFLLLVSLFAMLFFTVCPLPSFLAVPSYLFAFFLHLLLCSSSCCVSLSDPTSAPPSSCSFSY